MDSIEKLNLKVTPELLLFIDNEGVVVNYRIEEPAYLIAHDATLLGKKVGELNINFLKNEILESITQTRKKHTVTFFDTSIRIRDQENYYEFQIIPFLKNHILVIACNVTQLKKIESMLRTSEELFRSLYENATVGIYRTTPDGRILMANPAAVKMLGFNSFEELAKRNLESEGYEPSYDRKVFRERIKREGIIKGLESAWTRKDGSVIFVRESAKATFDENGEVLYYDGTFEDISDRKKMEEELKKLNKELEDRIRERTSQLESANKELESFAYSVSHDLRAPLRAIIGFTNILMEDHRNKLDDEGKRICNVISEVSNRMDKLIEGLLAYSRVGNIKMEVFPVDMKQIILSVYNELMINENKQKVNLQIKDLPVAVGDPRLLHDLWINLISNAIKFSSKKEKAKIEIGSFQENMKVVYYISDNGVGFDMNYANKLFGVFQRLHSDEDFEGTGVGLAIVQRIVHLHGGKIWAKAEVDKGATFYFTLGT